EADYRRDEAGGNEIPEHNEERVHLRCVAEERELGARIEGKEAVIADAQHERRDDDATDEEARGFRIRPATEEAELGKDPGKEADLGRNHGKRSRVVRMEGGRQDVGPD